MTTIQNVHETRTEFNVRLGAQILETVANRLRTEYPHATHLGLERVTDHTNRCVYRADYLYRAESPSGFNTPLDAEIDLIIAPGNNEWPTTSTVNLVNEISPEQWNALQEMRPELFGPDVFCDGSLTLVLAR